MLHLEEHSHREIAEVLGISETNVGTKLNRLKQKMRRDLAPERERLKVEFDELSTLWKEADRRLAALELPRASSLRTAREGMLDRMRSKLRFVHLVLWYEAGFGVLAALLAGSYLFDNLGDDPLRAAGALLHVGAILTLASAVRQLVALGQVDPAGPVVEMQKRLAELGLSRARANRWLHPVRAAAVGRAGGGGSARTRRARRVPGLRSGLGRRQLRGRNRLPGRSGLDEPAIGGRLPRLGVPRLARRGPDGSKGSHRVRLPGRSGGIRDRRSDQIICSESMP